MPFSAIYDACVLYPFQVRDILMVAATTRLFSVYWTDAILDECVTNLIKNNKANHHNMQRLVNKMKEIFPYATIELNDYKQLIPVMTNNMFKIFTRCHYFTALNLKLIIKLPTPFEISTILKNQV